MNAIPRWLSIIGIGEDGLAGLSTVAQSLIAQAGLVVGGQRHLKLAAAAITGETMVWPSPPPAAFPAILARRYAPVCVIATGDPFFYGIGSLLAAAVAPEEFICLPQPSAFSLAANRLGWAVQNCALVTLHGRRLETLLPQLQPNCRILALSWDATTPGRVAAMLTERGFGAARITVCAALGGPRETLRHATAESFTLEHIDPLNVVAIDIPAAPAARVIPLVPGLPDDWFDHDGQLTKREIRAVTLSALAPCRGELLWDIGAGSGAIGIEWMLRHPDNRAIGIERDPVRAARAARNAARLGVPDFSIVTGAAPEVLSGLAQPDAVFIGGGATQDGMIDAAWSSLRTGGRLVVNGVTIETQAMLTHYFKRMGGSLITLSISHAGDVGGFHAFRPAMTVMQWTLQKP